MQRIYSINDFLKQKFGTKVAKLCLDANLGCPHRKNGQGGCIFCSPQSAFKVGDMQSAEKPLFRGTSKIGERRVHKYERVPIIDWVTKKSGSYHQSGDCNFCSPLDMGEKKNGIWAQMTDQKPILKKKWGKELKYLAYFQSDTNTYGPIDTLDALYQEAISDSEVVGLIIATRADCLGDAVLDLLSAYQKKIFLWVELGIQTFHPVLSEWTQKGYGKEVEKRAFLCLKERQIPFVIHLILGMPGQKKSDFLEDIQIINQIEPFGVKFHMLNVLQGSGLAVEFEKEPFSLLSEEAYIDWVTDGLNLLSPHITVHRLTGDGAKALRVAPNWVGDKRKVLNGIHKALKQKEVFQGKGWRKV